MHDAWVLSWNIVCPALIFTISCWEAWESFLVFYETKQTPKWRMNFMKRETPELESHSAQWLQSRPSDPLSRIRWDDIQLEVASPSTQS